MFRFVKEMSSSHLGNIYRNLAILSRQLLDILLMSFGPLGNVPDVLNRHNRPDTLKTNNVGISMTSAIIRQLLF